MMKMMMTKGLLITWWTTQMLSTKATYNLNTRLIDLLLEMAMESGLLSESGTMTKIQVHEQANP